MVSPIRLLFNVAIFLALPRPESSGGLNVIQSVSNLLFKMTVDPQASGI